MKNLTHYFFCSFTIVLFFLILLDYPFNSAFAQAEVNNFFPASVPKYSVSVYDEVAGGYILMTPNSGGDPSATNTLMITDSVGNLLFYLNLRDSAGNFAPVQLRDFKVFDDGTLTFGYWQGNFGDEPYVLVDSQFNFIDTLFCGSFNMDNHDILKTSDGHYHVTCYADSIMDLSSLTTNSGVPGSSSGTTYSVSVQELDTTGETVLWEWNSLNYYPISDMLDSIYFVNPNILDLTHTNAIAIDLDGNYLMSQRNLHEIAKINKLTGEFMWRLGGTNNEFTYVNEPFRFSGQHDIRVLPNGNYTFFDNGRTSTPQVARAVEYSLDTANMTATKVWEYINPWGVSAGFIGNARRLDNGNTIINWGSASLIPGVITVNEVKQDGTVAMDLDLAGGFTYRAIKQDLPFQLIRPEIIYDSVSNIMSADTGYLTYIWSNGESSSGFGVEEAGYYQLFVNYGEGFISSNRITIPDVFDSLYVSGINDTSAVLHWTSVAGASAYLIRGAEEGTTIYITATVQAPDTSFFIGGLERSTSYEWQVKALYGATSSLFSLPNTFSTTFFGPPDSLLAGDITTTSVVLNWSPNPNAVQYLLRGKRVIDANYIELTLPGTSSQFPVSGLIANTQYHWQVQTIFTDQNSGYSKMDTFSTLPLCQPPGNLNETSLTSTSVTLNWDQVNPSQGYVLGGRLTGFSSFVTFEIAGSNNNFFNVNNLIPGATYEWTVVTKCGPGYLSSIPSVRSFTMLPAAIEKNGSAGGVNVFKWSNEDPFSVNPKISLYPNPANEQVSISLENFEANAEATINLYDIHGRIMTSSVINSAIEASIDLDEFPSGLYVVEVQAGEVVVYDRLIIN